ncbi:MAG: hypothetical protein COA84_16030 [Robiginitomaculum sp.]|nr:MAG: hypothetical protein COA84_16030 [Robiginitomaculum sp.]
MGNLFFSLKGRISPAQFQQGAIILIVINFALAMLPLVSISFALLAFPISLLLAWMWFSLWSKRLHDAGKSAWMVLLVLLVSFGLSFAATRLVYMVTGFDQATVTAAAQAAGTDIMGAMKASIEAGKSIVLPGAIAGAISTFIIVFLGNMVLKSDPEENQYGLATEKAVKATIGGQNLMIAGTLILISSLFVLYVYITPQIDEIQGFKSSFLGQLTVFAPPETAAQINANIQKWYIFRSLTALSAALGGLSFMFGAIKAMRK